VASACNPGIGYAGTALLASTLASALWIAVFSAASVESGWRRVGRIVRTMLYDLLSLLLIVALLAMVLSLFMPTYQCYTDRAKVAELVIAASSYRQEISERAQTRQSLAGAGEGLTVKAQGRVQGGSVSSYGVITLYSDAPKALVVLSPYLAGTQVEWKCAGFPLELMPLSCRALPYQNQ
jgi:type IV pilus assembly protein PilA